MSARPYAAATPGAPLTAELWNGWQVAFVQALSAHDHTGAGSGAPLSGSSFDPTGTLRVRALATQEVAFAGQSLAQLAQTAATEAARAVQQELGPRLSTQGGEIQGALKVTQGTTAARLRVGGALSVGGKPIDARALAGPRVATLGPVAPLSSQAGVAWTLYPELQLKLEIRRDGAIHTWRSGAAVPGLTWVLRGPGGDAPLSVSQVKAGDYEIFGRTPSNTTPLNAFPGILHVQLFPS